jgi:hypothetical protein
LKHPTKRSLMGKLFALLHCAVATEATTSLPAWYCCYWIALHELYVSSTYLTDST